MNPSQTNLNFEGEALKHLVKAFPGLPITSICKSDSLSSFLEGAVKYLTVPTFSQLLHTIKTMKDAVDAQQLKIQRRMIETDQQTMEGISEPNFIKSASLSTEEHHSSDSEQQCNVSDVWNWDIKEDMMNSMSSNKSYLDFID